MRVEQVSKVFAGDGTPLSAENGFDITPHGGAVVPATPLSLGAAPPLLPPLAPKRIPMPSMPDAPILLISP